MAPRFLQLHFLTSYPAALLNRDDAGFAKRLPFGGAVRTRISSQCLKRHWRTASGERSLGNLGVDLAIRSRQSFEKFVVEPLIHEGFNETLARAVTREVMTLVLGQSAKSKAIDSSEKEAKSAKGAKPAALQTNQVTVLGRPELDWILGETRAVCEKATDPQKVSDLVEERIGKKGRVNLTALAKAASGLDAALFGRMVTSDILSRGDAAVHVAHAFTVHEEETESDYFSAVDDLLQSEEGSSLGSGHINNTELTSGLYYGYVAVDIPLLVSNLEGCPRQDWRSADLSLTARTLETLIHLVATVSPGAKLGSTAPHSFAHMILAELGDGQPRTLANAFLKPVRTQGGEPDLLMSTYEVLARHIEDLDRMYGKSWQRRVAALGPSERLLRAADVENAVSLAQLTSWVGSEVGNVGRPLAAV